MPKPTSPEPSFSKKSHPSAEFANDFEALIAQKPVGYEAQEHIWLNPRTGRAWTTDAQVRKTLWMPLLRQRRAAQMNPSSSVTLKRTAANVDSMRVAASFEETELSAAASALPNEEIPFGVCNVPDAMAQRNYRPGCDMNNVPGQLSARDGEVV